MRKNLGMFFGLSRCGAGAVLLALGLVCYGLQIADIFGLGYFGTVHLLVGWVYVLGAPVFAPRLFPAEKICNPFHS